MEPGFALDEFLAIRVFFLLIEFSQLKVWLNHTKSFDSHILDCCFLYASSQSSGQVSSNDVNRLTDHTFNIPSPVEIADSPSEKLSVEIDINISFRLELKDYQAGIVSIKLNGHQIWDGMFLLSKSVP